jgi:hypothetical protein
MIPPKEYTSLFEVKSGVMLPSSSNVKYSGAMYSTVNEGLVGNNT